MTKILPDNTNNYLYVVENYHNICYNVNQLKSKFRSNDDEIYIMAVTKTVEPQIVNFAIENGITLLGENRVQEFLSKKDFYNKKASVHFIGTLQSNKVKYIVNEVSMIESVNSIKLAQEIDKHARQNNKIMEILVEVNIGEEESKSGIGYSDVCDLVSEIALLENIKVKGLMAIPPINAQEKIYAQMQELFQDIKSKNIENVSMEFLSMGMTNDYPMAIKYGSNIVRIGTGLFGKRK